MKNQKDIWNELYKHRLTWKKEAVNLPNLLKGKSVLEIGVGTGKTLQSILRQNPKSVAAIDFSEEALLKCRNNLNDPRVKLTNSNIITFQSKNKFDIIICYYVLNNLTEEERQKAANTLKTFLNPKGIILFEDFAAGDFREKQERKDGLICHFFREGEIKELFANFREIKIKARSSSPIRTRPKIRRKIISAVIIS